MKQVTKMLVPHLVHRVALLLVLAALDQPLEHDAVETLLGPLPNPRGSGPISQVGLLKLGEATMAARPETQPRPFELGGPGPSVIPSP